MVDVTKLNKFVGMLGSEHDGEQVNAARFIKRLAAEEKLSLVELFTKAYGGGVRVEEKIVYRDRPAEPAREGFRSMSEEEFNKARARSREQKRADFEERKASRAAGPKSRAYGHNGSLVSKIRTVLAYHSMALTKWEKDFLEDLVRRVDTGYEMSPRQRSSYMKIMEKVGYAN
jgi:hypothetical protein